jgi:hypothetical protein
MRFTSLNNENRNIIKKKYNPNLKFIKYGLPIYDGEEENPEAMKLVTKYLPEWEQVAVDEKGRRRFHGAFTGNYIIKD